jgi:hypothetical protein
MRRFQLRAQVGCMPNEIKEEEKTLLIAVVANALLNKSALHADCNTLGTTANRPTGSFTAQRRTRQLTICHC